MGLSCGPEGRRESSRPPVSPWRIGGDKSEDREAGAGLAYRIGNSLEAAACAFALEDIDREEDEPGESIGDNPALGVFASLGF